MIKELIQKHLTKAQELNKILKVEDNPEDKPQNKKTKLLKQAAAALYTEAI